MSAKERRRAVIMANVKAEELKVVAAADVLGLSYMQAKRVWRRYAAQGDAGLVHRLLRGQPGRRRKPAKAPAMAGTQAVLRGDGISWTGSTKR